MAMAGAGPTRPSSTQTVAMGSGKPLSLDQNSISIDVLLTDQQRSQLRSLLLQPSSASPAAGADSSIRIVLDGVHLTALGEKGGYFYSVYINLPEQGATAGTANRYLLGMLGAFEIGAARMRMQMQGSTSMASHAAPMSAAGAPLQLVFPATKALREAWPENLDKLTVSFVRANGGKPAHGTVIKVREFRVETSATPAR
jgi:tyrosinase